LLLTAERGFAQGFGRFQAVPDMVGKPFGAKVKRALEWMEEVRAQRFFLFLHTYAVHLPFDPEPPHDQYGDPGYEGPYKRSFGPGELAQTEDGRDLTDADVRQLEALYDGGIAELDTIVGELINGLRNRGLAQSTCLLLTSDHGEEFREHGDLLHHHAKLFDELLRVPLIVWCPRLIAAPRSIDTVVSLVDVAPTLLALAGAPIPPGLDGVDLAPLWRGEVAAVRDSALSEVEAGPQGGQGSVAALRDEHYKLIERMPGGQRQLFDLRDDPAEIKDISRREPRVVKRLLKELRARRRVGRLERGEGMVPAAQPTMDAATLERLRALGYVK
jgi:arylsulfatase A-like enzyme